MEGKKEQKWYWEKIQETLSKIGPKKTILQWKKLKLRSARNIVTLVHPNLGYSGLNAILCAIYLTLASLIYHTLHHALRSIKALVRIRTAAIGIFSAGIVAAVHIRPDKNASLVSNAGNLIFVDNSTLEDGSRKNVTVVTLNNSYRQDAVLDTDEPSSNSPLTNIGDESDESVIEISDEEKDNEAQKNAAPQTTFQILKDIKADSKAIKKIVTIQTLKHLPISMTPGHGGNGNERCRSILRKSCVERMERKGHHACGMGSGLGANSNGVAVVYQAAVAALPPPLDLKKVAAGMQTYKNPTLRTGPAAFKPTQFGSASATALAAASMVKDPIFTRDGKK
uniref:Uncharacterized protein n=1 Tax=Glossina palpalis gambiensis TaxID=67801 RepID=A0A1B0BVU3_9MUSC